MRGIALILAAGLAMNAGAATDHPVVRTEQGEVAGIARDGMQVFYGLPFAAPPVGELRWRAPQRPAAWSGIRDASQPASACAQDLTPGAASFPKGMSEDCLYLNVFAPGKARSKRMPVMVWIHGGSFRWGSAMDPAFDSSAALRSTPPGMSSRNVQGEGVRTTTPHPSPDTVSADRTYGVCCRRERVPASAVEAQTGQHQVNILPLDHPQRPADIRRHIHVEAILQRRAQTLAGVLFVIDDEDRWVHGGAETSAGLQSRQRGNGRTTCSACVVSRLASPVAAYGTVGCAEAALITATAFITPRTMPMTQQTVHASMMFLRFSRVTLIQPQMKG